MAITRNSLSQDMLDHVQGLAFESYMERPKIYESLFDVQASTKAYEKGTDSSMLANVEEVDELVGATESDIVEGFTWYIANRTLTANIPLSYEAIQDGRLNLDDIGRNLGMAFSRTEETRAARIFNQGAKAAGDWIFNTRVNDEIADQFGELIYDSQPFFSTAHPDKQRPTATTYSNYNASKTLTEANLEDVIEQFEYTNAYDNAGNKIMLQPNVLLIPPSLRFEASKLLNTAGMPGTALNDINPVEGYLTPIVWPYLDDSDGWFIGNAKSGIRWYNRTGLNIRQVDDPERRRVVIVIYKRVGVGVTNWRYWLANNIASA